MLKALHRGLVGRTGHQRHDFGLELFVAQHGAQGFKLGPKIKVRGVYPHHGNCHVHKSVQHFHQVQKRLGILGRETADFGGGFLRVAPEHQRTTIGVQVHVAGGHFHLAETVPLQLQLQRHHGVHPQRHQVQRAGVHHMLGRCRDHMARGGHAANLVQRFNHHHFFTRHSQVTRGRKAVVAATDDGYVVLSLFHVCPWCLSGPVTFPATK